LKSFPVWDNTILFLFQTSNISCRKAAPIKTANQKRIEERKQNLEMRLDRNNLRDAHGRRFPLPPVGNRFAGTICAYNAGALACANRA